MELTEFANCIEINAIRLLCFHFAGSSLEQSEGFIASNHDLESIGIARCSTSAW